METGTDTPTLYTLICGDVGTREQYIKIYTSERGKRTTPLYTLISGDLGTRGQFSRIYLRRLGQTHHPYTLLFLGTASRIYTYGDREIKYHRYVYTLISGDVGTVLWDIYICQ